MSNAMKYIKDLEAAGFERSQAEAQVQMVLDALEGDLVTKAEFAAFRTEIKSEFTNFKTEMRGEFGLFQERLENKFALSQQNIQSQVKELEFRIVTKLGVMMGAMLSIAVATLTWLVRN